MNRAVGFALAWTAIVVGMTAYAVRRFDAASSLNELGDFIAGVAAAETFGLLIATYLMQANESRLARQEFSVMSQTLSDQTDQRAREEGLQQCRLGIGALDQCAVNFEDLLERTKRKVFGGSQSVIPHLFSFGILANRCLEVDGRDSDAEAAIKKYGEALNRQISRYARIYRRMKERLEGNPQWADGLELLTRDSLHEEAYRVISDAATAGGLSSEVFRVSDESR